ncbi:MAG TPA: F0F1 ATP synthase subunit C [Thermoanaerobaculia bacterium]|nr:F0F1 ATP synthase subunit C [Thermoanaerobaculia bacterium]
MNRKNIIMFVVLMLTAVSAFAQAPTAAGGTGVRWGVVSAAFVLGIAAAAGAIGQARAIAASVEGIARNPSAAPAIRLAMIIGLALIESLVIYALVIAFILQGK